MTHSGGRYGGRLHNQEGNMKLIRTAVKPASQKPAFDFAGHYINGFIRNMQRYIDSGNTDRDALKRSVYFGVKYVAGNQKTEDPKRLLSFAHVVKLAIAELSPAELIAIFPVQKAYNGQRTESKDYFYTMDQLNAHGMKTKIGDAVDDMLWDFRNLDIEFFTIRCLGLIDEIRRMDGQPGLIEAHFGIKPRFLCKNAQGKEFLFDPATGRTAKVKPRTRMHVVGKRR